jgi:hypothetical protein
MPVDNVSSGFIPKQTTLFRPVTQSSLRSNMSDFFNRTQEFVGDQLEGIANSYSNEDETRRAQREDNSFERRLQPQGMGKFVDMLI